MQENDESIVHNSADLINSHNLCTCTEDTWVVNDWLSPYQPWAHPADVTVGTLALTRCDSWLPCVVRTDTTL